MKHAEDIRSANDRRLFETLSARREVRQANERIERLSEQGQPSVRRRLLSTSVRLTPGMAPSVHKMAADCSQMLGIDTNLELFVYSSPSFNAACFKPEDGRVFVMFSSSLLEAFEENELKFVMGHELGHHVYRHHDIPIGFILNGRSGASPRLALELFAWSRYAEISADRAGAHCAQDMEATARALFKLASGLTGRFIRFSLEEFLEQVDEMQVEAADPESEGPREDWFLTHPFSPLRVKALELFDKSELVRPHGMQAADLEAAVQDLMGLMEPSYLEGHTKTTESMRRLLFAGAIAIAAADGQISEQEIEVFEQFFGDGSFNKGPNIEALQEDLDNRLDQARARTSVPQRMQVLRDLCLVARAEKSTSKKAQDVLSHIARGLQVPEAMVAQSLECSIDLD
jgi:Zn-dependent protease with chaperone function